MFISPKMPASTSKNVTNSYPFGGSIATSLWVATAHYSGRREQYHPRDFLSHSREKGNGCTKSQNICSLEVSMDALRFWPTVFPATTLEADTQVGGFNPHLKSSKSGCLKQCSKGK